MLDIKLIRENPEIVRNAIKRKHTNVDLEMILELDKNKRELQTRIEKARSDRNKLSKEITKASVEEKASIISEVEKIKEFLKEAEPRFNDMEKELNYQLLLLPGIPHETVPDGNSDEDSIEIKRVGDIPEFDFEIKDHLEIGKSWFDFYRGAKVAGSRTVYLKGIGALLEQAVLQLALNHLLEKGFTLFSVPQMVKEMAMEGTGFLPRGQEECYFLERDERYLIGTSEVPLVSYHADEIFSAKELPKKYAGFSTCYRREAGAAGKDTKGLYRIHQFQKIEQVVFCINDLEESKKWHYELLNNAEEILQLLELPYRVVIVCAGEMGLPQHFKHDIECYMPGRKNYGETMSCSTMHDFQARRLNIKYREGTDLKYCHTLNNTAIATPRILIPLIEIHQQKDGSIYLPRALRKYMNNREKIERED
ncbi:MAG: serine--tRNA ligase [Candidatus Coatesbacteria bacterium]|nr:serine--tRNA ligase [Candidatus Coatesbacteria bacterium]